MAKIDDRLAEIMALADAATEGPWEVGDRNIVAGVIKDGRCHYCDSEGEPSWVGRRNINGRVMLAHVHQRAPWDDDTSVYAKRIDGSSVVALSTSEYVTIDADDAAFIAASRTMLPAAVAAIEAVLALHTRPAEPYCSDSHHDANRCPCADYYCSCDGETYPCPTVRAITAALDSEVR